MVKKEQTKKKEFNLDDEITERTINTLWKKWLRKRVKDNSFTTIEQAKKYFKHKEINIKNFAKFTLKNI